MMEFVKEGTLGQEYKVPLKIAVSPVPLFIKVTIGPQFPYIRPVITVMSRVTHPSIEQATYNYTGKLLQSWTETSQLVVLVKTIEAEFNEKPPTP